jgi:hypothetical protein
LSLFHNSSGKVIQAFAPSVLSLRLCVKLLFSQRRKQRNTQGAKKFWVVVQFEIRVSTPSAKNLAQRRKGAKKAFKIRHLSTSLRLCVFA